VNRVCAAAAAKSIGVSIDAEETWIQDPVDMLTILMMEQYNKEKPIVYNTLQHYRHDRLKFLQDSYDAAVARNFILGSKLVRGAYMERERRRRGIHHRYNPIRKVQTAILMPGLNSVLIILTGWPWWWHPIMNTVICMRHSCYRRKGCH
jgi:hypothetical protein